MIRSFKEWNIFMSDKAYDYWKDRIMKEWLKDWEEERTKYLKEIANSNKCIEKLRNDIRYYKREIEDFKKYNTELKQLISDDKVAQ